MPLIVGMLNGIFSLVKYGLSDCYDDFGIDPGSRRSKDDGSYEKSLGILHFGPTIVSSHIAASLDDAEETVISNDVSLVSLDLEFGANKQSSLWV